MNCKHCGTCLDTNEFVVRTVKFCICHLCGQRIDNVTIRGIFVDNKVYDNGELVHRYKVEPYPCPHCGSIFGGHEFYCNVMTQSGFEGLEEAAQDTHPKMGIGISSGSST